MLDAIGADLLQTLGDGATERGGHSDVEAAADES
jgi:hypothetical protein